MSEQSPVRILIVDGKLINGGVEAFIMNIYRHIDRNKLQFDFLVHYKERFFYDDEIESLGGKIYRLSFRNDNNYLKYKRDLKNFFNSHKEYKIIWGHMDGLASVYLKAAKKSGVPITIAHSHITSSENSVKGLVKRVLRHNLSKYTDYRFACSTEAGKYLYKSNDFKLIHNAIDVEKFKFDKAIRNKIRRERNWEGYNIIGHVGRFFPQKNHLYLIKIFKALCEVDDSYKLCLCGDGEDRAFIESKVKEYNLSSKIEFTGNVSNMNEFYQGFDLFILPSLYEGLPVSGIEAQTSGLPCLFSKNITKETELLSDIVKFISIENEPQEWINPILSFKENQRLDRSTTVKNMGYDIKDLSDKLQRFFTEIYR